MHTKAYYFTRSLLKVQNNKSEFLLSKTFPDLYFSLFSLSNSNVKFPRNSKTLQYNMSLIMFYSQFHVLKKLLQVIFYGGGAKIPHKETSRITLLK